MARGPTLQTAVAKDFRGGLNTLDSPLNLSTKYLIGARNVYPDSNGRLRVRYGYSVFTDTSAVLDEIIGTEYYAGAIIAVGANGKIVSVTADGVVTESVLATPWSTDLTYASFTQFAGQLIICNGVDKPVTMDETYAVDYVEDPGTSSNTNVPRAKYCTTHNGHLILAVTPDDTYTLYISSKGVTSFEGDPGADVNAINVDTSIYVDRGVPIITGLSGYRDRLIVTFQETLLAMQLGAVDATTGQITVNITDSVANHGSISHKAIVSIGAEMLMPDGAGIASIKREILGTDFLPTRISSLINSDVQKALTRFSSNALSLYVFAIHDRLAQQVLFFIPKIDTVTSTTDNDVFVYCYDRTQKLSAWTRFDGLPFRSGHRTTDGRIFLAAGTTLYYYRNAYEPLYTDGVVYNDQDWDDGDPWDDGTGWVEPTLVTATPIEWSFDLPWTEFNQPLMVKATRFLHLTAEGESTINVGMYTDRFPNPLLSITFISTDTPFNSSVGFRPATNDHQYVWNASFIRMRLSLSGSANSTFSIVAIGVQYLTGSIRR